MPNSPQRNLFVNFLDNLLKEPSSTGDWFEFAVNHYHDEKIKNIRRELVRLLQTDDELLFTNEQQLIIRH